MNKCEAMDQCDCILVDGRKPKPKPLSEVPPYYYSPPMDPLNDKSEDSVWYNKKTENLVKLEDGFLTCKKNEWEPCHKHLANFYVRLRTFSKWPKQMRPSAEELTQAGFSYRFEGDVTSCFFCGVTVHNWEEDDNAFVEHKKWSPTCKYLNMIY